MISIFDITIFIKKVEVYKTLFMIYLKFRRQLENKNKRRAEIFAEIAWTFDTVTTIC